MKGVVTELVWMVRQVRAIVRWFKEMEVDEAS